jgi:hypothetical protein
MELDLRRKLVSALLRCAVIKDRHRRDTIVNDLPDEIQVNIRRDPVDRFDVANIIDRCADYPTGVKKLIESAHWYEGNSIHMRDVLRISSYHLRPGFLEWEQHKALIELTNRIRLTPEEIQALFRESLPPEFRSRVQLQKDELWCAFENLRDIRHPTPGDRYPLLEFVQGLAKLPQAQAVARELEDWVKQTCEFLKIDYADVTSSPGEDMIPTYLLVEVIPDEYDAQKYTLHISSWKGPGDAEYLYQEDTRYTLKDIPRVLFEKLYEQCAPDDLADLSIEVFLPYTLISHPVDQWIDPEDPLETKLGLDHQVSVRSLNRFTNRRLQRYWHKKWKYFQRHAERSTVRHICHWKRYTKRELHNALIRENSPACLGLTFTPMHNQEGKLLIQILRAGIPVALWPRLDEVNVEYSDMLREKVEDIIENTPNLLKLPDTLRDMRIQAENDPIHLCNHLTLLWDDPDRVPPLYGTDHQKIRFRPPD